MSLKPMLTDLFGTDAACGVAFVEEVAEGQPRRWSAAEYDALPEPKPDAYSMLPNDWSGVCCTGYAHLVAERLGRDRVQVVGFANEDNPASRVARHRLHPGGHDFAVVDDRYVVDPWIKLVVSASDQIVFDTHDTADDMQVRDLYGPSTCWKPLCE